MAEVRKKVLVAPLDWGLGHATRSIPVIRELHLKGCEVCIASSGDALLLLKNEFPTIQFFELPGYKASYSRWMPLIVKIFLQLPRFLLTIKKEHEQLERIVSENQIVLVISDNRFGCWTEKVPTVFITHQINIQMPLFLKWMQGSVNYFNHARIKKFDYCWVPDFAQDKLTGRMTESGKLPVRFIGMLSRFKRRANKVTTYDYLALVSGPEPQRTIFEQKVRLCFSQLKGRKILIRGLPGLSQEIIHNTDWDEVCHLNSEKLQTVIEESGLVICRSGYSTVMDLAALGKKAVFVPTPGQTEQEYLANQLMEKRIGHSVNQRHFSGKDCITEGYSGFQVDFSLSDLKKEIDVVLESR